MKKHIAAWTATILVCLCVASARAGEQKTAVVDMGKLIGAHPDKAAAETLLQKQVDDFEAEQKAMDGEREKIKEEFEKIRAETEDRTLSEDARRDKLKEAEKKIIEMRELERKSRDTAATRRQQLAEEKRRMQGQVVSKIRDIIKDYAKKKEFTLVLDSASVGMQGVESVIFHEPDADITDDILKLIGKQKKD